MQVRSSPKVNRVYVAPGRAPRRRQCASNPIQIGKRNKLQHRKLVIGRRQRSSRRQYGWNMSDFALTTNEDRSCNKTYPVQIACAPPSDKKVKLLATDSDSGREPARSVKSAISCSKCSIDPLPTRSGIVPPMPVREISITASGKFGTTYSINFLPKRCREC